MNTPRTSRHYGYQGEMMGGREVGRALIDKHYSGFTPKAAKVCTAYADFREMMEKEDLNAIGICTPDHWPPIAPIQTAHRSISIAHLGNIGLRLGRTKLKWDPKTEEFADDAGANSLLKRESRKPWVL